MRFIVRPGAGWLALAETTDTEDGPHLLLLPGQETGKERVSLPDEAFMALLKSSGIYDEMVRENPDRMRRVEGVVGVGMFRREHKMFTDLGITMFQSKIVSPPAGMPVAAVAA